MPRYFLEVSYKGTAYSGFQSQHNTPNTVQAEIEKAFNTLYRPVLTEGDSSAGVTLVSSSRTDAGVHALQNFFHFDTVSPLDLFIGKGGKAQFAYKMNAILPGDVVVRKLHPVRPDAHCRFDALSREYRYYIYREKDPFLKDRAFYFPYKLDWEVMEQAASIVKEYTDFTSFSKRNTQVKTFNCTIQVSEWIREEECFVYHVKGNRFLRGMVRALTATMLKVGRGKISLDSFRQIIEARDCTQASFAVPAQGLFLVAVDYPPDQFLTANS